MTIGAALALIAVGAILRFAITTPVNGIAIPTIGLILMIIGAIGVVLWLIFWSPWARTRRVVYREDVPPEALPPARRYPADTRVWGRIPALSASGLALAPYPTSLAQ